MRRWRWCTICNVYSTPATACRLTHSSVHMEFRDVEVEPEIRGAKLLIDPEGMLVRLSPDVYCPCETWCANALLSMLPALGGGGDRRSATRPLTILKARAPV